jgi:hypothetical protein
VLTPEVLEILQWFEWTHEVSATVGAAWWSMVRLPGDGGLGAQDARLMAALETVRGIQNALLNEQQKKGDPEQERQAFHEQVRAEQR